jgi:hypothetical protein
MREFLVKKLRLRESLILFICISILATHLLVDLSILPCRSNCGDNCIATQSSGLNDQAPEGIALSIDTQFNTNSCEACVDYYKSLFSVLFILEQPVDYAINTTVVEDSVPAFNNRIPDPYRTPPA